MGTELATALVTGFWICVLITLRFKDRATIDFHKEKLVELDCKIIIMIELITEIRVKIKNLTPEEVQE